MNNVTNIVPKAQFIPWGSGVAIKRAGTILAIISRDELPDLGVAVATALKDAQGNRR